MPIPNEPLFVSRAHSVRPFGEFFVKNASAEAAVVVDTLDMTLAIRAELVAVVVAPAHPLTEHCVSLNKRPVPIPACVEVAK